MDLKNTLFRSLTGIVVLMTVNTARSQIVYDGTALNYTQDFDSLGSTNSTWADNSRLLGWYLAATLPSFTGTLTANTGSASGNSVAYNLGVDGTHPLSDRALGWLTTTTKTGTTYTGVQLQNNSGQNYIGPVTFSFTYEQWSAKNAASDPLYVEYQTNVVSADSQLTNGVWTQLESIASPNLSASGGAIDGNAPGNFTPVTETVTFTADSPWLAGDYLWFRVRDEVISGRNDMNGIDDVSINIPATNSPPLVSITSPANNLSFNPDSSISITANASVVGAGSITNVEFYANSTDLGNATSTPYSFTWLNVPAGIYSLTAVASDAAGISATSAVVTITVAMPSEMFVTLPGETFVTGSGNSGVANSQDTTVPFDITLTAVDSYTNIATGYNGVKTVSYSGPSGSPVYTTNVTFNNGQALSVSTMLNTVETTTITATDGLLTGVPSSPLTVVLNERVKADNFTSLQTGSSWVEGTAPGPGDIAVFNNIYADWDGYIATGSALSWRGIRILDPGNPVFIETGANGIKFGTNGIDMSSATMDLTLDANNNFPITASGVTLMPWNIADGRTLTIYGKVYPHGVLQVQKTGFGTVVLDAPSMGTADPSGAQDWGSDGFLQISQGIVQANDAYILGGAVTNSRSTLILDGGTFRFGNSFEIANPWPIKITTNSGSVIDDGGYVAQVPNVIQDATTAGSLIKAGSGTLTLTATNTYSGGTIVSNGTLEAQSDGALGLGNVTVTSGATLELDGGIANSYIYAGANLLLQTGANPVNLAFTGSPNHVAGLSFDGGATFLATGTWGSSSSGATYPDDTHFSGSGTLLVTTNAGITLVSSLNPAVSGQPVVFTATVTGGVGTPTGTVTFNNGATMLGTGTLNGAGAATYTNSTLPVGTNTIAATYGGDNTYSAVTSTSLFEIITAAETQPVITGVNSIAGGIVLSGTNGTPNAGFSEWTSTNVALPLASWIMVTNGTYDALGSFTVTNLVNPADSQRFYLLSTP